MFTRRQFLRTSAALAASSGLVIGEEKRHAKQLDYRLPLNLAKSQATRCTILASPMAAKGQTLQISTSADGQTWTSVEPEKKERAYTVAIPAACVAAGALHLRLERCAVSGFALRA